MYRYLIGISLTLALTAATCGCGRSPSAPAISAENDQTPTSIRINAGGSTFVFPMMSKWTSEYEKAKGVQINYQSIGSGAGIRQMTSRTIDFGCTDGPMNGEQLKKATEVGGEVVHIPLTMGAVVVAYNLDAATVPMIFSGPVLADIFLGRINRWNDPAIQSLNPKVDLPDMGIAVVHRTEGSGTTFVWADYLSKVSSEWKNKVGVGTSVRWPCGIGQKGNEGVAGMIRRVPGSLGYLEMTFALQNQIPIANIVNRAGHAITPELKSVTAAADSSLAQIPDDLCYSLTDAPGSDAYPISGTVWAVTYVNLPTETGRVVADFLRWATHEGQELVEPLHYSRLPNGLVKRLEAKLDQIAQTTPEGHDR